MRIEEVLFSRKGIHASVETKKTDEDEEKEENWKTVQINRL